jgi:hypothetical protein
MKVFEPALLRFKPPQNYLLFSKIKPVLYGVPEDFVHEGQQAQPLPLPVNIRLLHLNPESAILFLASPKTPCHHSLIKAR